MDYIRYANQSATRNLPLSQDLVSALSFLPELGVQAEVFSGGQPVAGQGPRVGSTRHDLGGAADVFFYKDGRRLDWANPDDLPIFQEIVSRGRQAGLTGFGAGPDYMQPGSMHIGFGNPAVWGAGGKGANAPSWLRQAYYGADAPTGGNMAPQTGLLGNATISTQGQMPQQEPERLPFFQRPGVADFFDTLAIGLQGMTLNPNQALMQAAQAGIERRREAAQTAQQRNRTVEALKQMGADPQLIQLAEAGFGQAALSEAVRRSRESTVMPAGFRTLAAQAEAAGLEPGTPEYQEFMLYGGMARESQPAGFRSLDAQARAAGFVPKSEGGGGEYENFMATAGKGLSAEAAASGRARGESAVQLSGARVAAQRALELVELLRSDEALPSMVGPIQGRAPNISAASQRFQSRLDQLQGVAFLEAYNMLRGGGQITEVEGQKAERAIARLNTAQSEEDFLQALSEFEDAVRTGVQKLEAEAGVTPTSPQTSDDPLSLRGG